MLAFYTNNSKKQKKSVASSRGPKNMCFNYEKMIQMSSTFKEKMYRLIYINKININKKHK